MTFIRHDARPRSALIRCKGSLTERCLKVIASINVALVKETRWTPLGFNVKILMLFCRITRKKLIVHVHDLLKDHPFLLNRFCKLVPPSEVGRPVLYH